MNNLNTYRHWYLYCKNWYKKTDLIEDFKKIQSNWSGIDVEYITEYDVLHLILQIVWPHINNKYDFFNFMEDQLEGNLRFIGGEFSDNHIKRIILSAKSIITSTNIDDIDGELGSPDFSILPKRES